VIETKKMRGERMKPNFQEPWKTTNSHYVDDCYETTLFHSPYSDVVDRAVACVNACEGMENPANEIANLKKTDKKYSALRMKI
jgi:hypothetical protein